MSAIAAIEIWSREELLVNEKNIYIRRGIGSGELVCHSTHTFVVPVAMFNSELTTHVIAGWSIVVWHVSLQLTALAVIMFHVLHECIALDIRQTRTKKKAELWNRSPYFLNLLLFKTHLFKYASQRQFRGPLPDSIRTHSKSKPIRHKPLITEKRCTPQSNPPYKHSKSISRS